MTTDPQRTFLKIAEDTKKRKTMAKPRLTPMVIAYDFDGTLASGNMQEYDFLPALGIKPAEFWRIAKDLAKKEKSDEILAYMQIMLEKADAKHVPVTKEVFSNFGRDIPLFDGVPEWFNRINAYAKSKQIKLEHYIISSGLREMLEGTCIAKKFKRIYASGFMYGHNNIAHWPALAINYTTKTQYLFRINKNSLDEHDNSRINKKFVADSDRPVPFANMVFIGDGETDIPCMRLVKEQGGHSIAVYESRKRNAKEKAQHLVDDGRATLAAVADYREDKDIDIAIKAIIDKVAAQAVINKTGLHKKTTSLKPASDEP